MDQSTASAVSETIKVSAIIPIYNVEDLIETTIEALLKQTLQEVEFILVDDGSTDGSLAVAQYYANDNPKLRVVHQENAGPAAARNHGLRLAQGQFICFIDSDDFMAENALDMMYEAALEHDADLVMGGTVRFNSERTWPIAGYVKHGIMNPGEKHITTHPGLLYAMGPCAKLYKREIINNTYFPENIRLGEDQPFALHAYLQAKKIYTVDAIVYYYRFREGDNKSLTQRAMEKPSLVFNDLFEMVRMTNEQLADDSKLHTFYLQRVMVADILPRFRAALASRIDEVQGKVLRILYDWIRSINHELFNSVPGIYTYVVIGTLYCYRYLGQESRPLARQLIKFSLKQMALKNYLFFGKALFQEGGRTIKRILWRVKAKAKNLSKPILLKRVVFPFAKRVRKVEPKKIVFATNRSEELEGNLYEIWNEVVQHHPDWSVEVFAKKNRTFHQMIELYQSLATAKLVVLDDYYYPLYGLTCRKDTEVIQTWHASGAFKKFGLSAIGAKDSNPKHFEEAAHRSYTKVLTTSSAIVPRYMEAFNKSADQVLPLGLPKNDVFFNKEVVEVTRSKYRELYPQLRGKKILLYAPTFRGSPKERVSFKLMLDLKAMKAQLQQDYVLVLKLHPMVRKGITISEQMSDFVLNLSNGDINELLMISDVLISDYSSVVFEYSLMKRPMIFFAYDLEEYLEERGFYYDYRSFVPGPIARDTSEVIQHIVNQDYSLAKVETFSQYFFDYRDGRALKRFTETFL